MSKRVNARWGLGRSETCLRGTDRRMFPPPWNDCSWTVSALCPCRDGACLFQLSPEPKISCGCQPSTSGKFPSREASPTLAAAQCPWFLVGHLAPWDNFWPWLPLQQKLQLSRIGGTGVLTPYYNLRNQQEKGRLPFFQCRQDYSKH